MYALVEIGGSQYKVEKNSELLVDLMDKNEGDKLDVDRVCVYRDDKDILIGTPYLEKVKIDAEVLDPLVKGDKIIVFKYKSKTNYRVKTGHRQKYTRIKINNIKLLSQTKTSKAKVPETDTSNAKTSETDTSDAKA